MEITLRPVVNHKHLISISQMYLRGTFNKNIFINYNRKKNKQTNQLSHLLVRMLVIFHNFRKTLDIYVIKQVFTELEIDSICEIMTEKEIGHLRRVRKLPTTM